MSDTTDTAALVERLRRYATALWHYEAADTIERQAARTKELEERLEINHAYQEIDGKLQRVEADMSDCDGIMCRDETIKLQDKEIARMAARIATLEEALRDAAANLTGAASAYRKYARRASHLTPKADTDPFFATRAADFDKAVERTRRALEADHG